MIFHQYHKLPEIMSVDRLVVLNEKKNNINIQSVRVTLALLNEKQEYNAPLSWCSYKSSIAENNS